MDSMEIDDNIFINKNCTMYSLKPRANSQQRKRPSCCVSVCVGLALVVLLAGVVGQAVYYEVFSRRPPGLPDDGLVDQLRGTNASLHNERKELQVRLRNLTEERELLLEHLNSERDEFQHRLTALTSERDLLSASYNESRREGGRLTAAAATMGRDLRELQANCSRLRATAERLHVDNADLQRRNVNLNASLERQKKSQAAAEAQSELSAVRFRDRYESLQRDKEELNGSCQVLRREMQQLQRNYTLLAAAQYHLRVQLENMKRVQRCPPGWRKFNESCYFFATSSKNWESSRQYCKSKGGDLVVVNSREEQAFISQVIPKGTHVWIGLSDILVEGTWTWVDGTPLTLKFWYPGQPNNQGEQDCGELVQTMSGDGLWNDESCTTDQTWICEK